MHPKARFALGHNLVFFKCTPNGIIFTVGSKKRQVIYNKKRKVWNCDCEYESAYRGSKKKRCWHVVVAMDILKVREIHTRKLEVF